MAIVREASFSDIDSIIALMSRSGLEFKNKNREEWRHIWNNSPALAGWREPWPIGWVIEAEEGRIVGFLGNIPLIYHFRGKRLMAADATSMAVDSLYRNYSILLLKYFFDQPSVDLFLNTGANYEAGKIFSAFRSGRIPQSGYDNVLFWIVDYKKCVRQILQKKGRLCGSALTPAVSFLLKGIDGIIGRGGRKRYGKAAVQCVEDFDERFDLFWSNLADSNKTLLRVRDRQYLSWHFKYALLQKRVWIFVTHRNSSIINYAIFLRQDNKEIGLRRVRLVDFQTVDNGPSAIADMIVSGIKRCRREGIHILEVIGFGAGKRDAVKRLVPYTRNLPNWPFYYKTREVSLRQALNDPAAWDASLLDGDASL